LCGGGRAAVEQTALGCAVVGGGWWVVGGGWWMVVSRGATVAGWRGAFEGNGGVG